MKIIEDKVTTKAPEERIATSLERLIPLLQAVLSREPKSEETAAAVRELGSALSTLRPVAPPPIVVPPVEFPVAARAWVFTIHRDANNWIKTITAERIE